jgi:hypothetical protein
VELLKDPVAYAAHSKKKNHYPQILARSIELARCIIEQAERPDGAANLAWVHDFGTMFVEPAEIQADTGPCREHSPYLAPTGLAYCPQPSEAQGVCSNKPSPRPGINPCGGGEFSAVQHYQLSSVHSEDELKKLDKQIGAFLLACPRKSAT